MMNPHKRYSYLLIVSLFAGALLPLAFAPHSLWPLAFVAFIPICYLWQRSAQASHCFWHTTLFTFAAFLVGASWVYISIHVFGQASSFTASLITFIFVGFLALQAGILAFLWRKLLPQRNYWNHCWLLPAVWTLTEYCREWIFTGFPWLSVGNIGITPWLSGWLPLVGVYGLTFLIICTCAHIAYAINKKTLFQAGLAAFLLLVLFGVGRSLDHYEWTKKQTTPLHVALIQGNIPASLKWDPKKNMMTIDRYLAATKKHLDADVIIWPETAIPTFDTYAPHFLKALNSLMQQNNATLITGISHADKKTHNAYNSMLVLGHDEGRYDKTHLVPFGEYFPMPWLLGWIYHAIGLPMSNYSAGNHNQAPLKAQDTLVAPAICYEVAYPSLIQARARLANWLVVISDDAWFGHSAASAQQLQMAQVRALENGRPLVYATNNGITALINSHGVITQRLPIDKYQVLTGSITPRKGLTPFQHLPLHTWTWLCLLLLAGTAVRFFFKK